MGATRIKGLDVGDGSVTEQDLDLSGAAAKATPVSADSIIIVDSVAPSTPKRTLISAFLSSFSLYIGTTAISLARASGALSLSGVTIDQGYATTATAAGTTTLTAASGYNQYFTGSTTQTVVMPVTSTLVLGKSFRIVNNSTGLVTVNSSGGNAIVILASGGEVILTCILTSGTTAASWDAWYGGSIVSSGKKLTVNNSLTLAGTDGTTQTFQASDTIVGRTTTDTLTNKRKQPRVYTVASTATLTPEIASYDLFTITAQAASLTIANHSTSTPAAGEKMIIRIKDNATARAISFGTYYRAMGNALPTTTVVSKTLYLGFIWNSTDSKWDLIAVAQES
jgi:hypothetical protein